MPELWKKHEIACRETMRASNRKCARDNRSATTHRKFNNVKANAVLKSIVSGLGGTVDRFYFHPRFWPNITTANKRFLAKYLGISSEIISI